MKPINKLIVLALLLLGFAGRSRAQSFEVQQLLLNAEKLTQFKAILSDMKRGYQTLTTGYNLVKNVSQGNFSLHETFLNGLMLVSPEVRKYHKVADILKMQSDLLKSYKTAYNQFREAGSFSMQEIKYLDAVYSQLFSQSLRHLDELTLVITSGKLRMSDEERLTAIDRIFEGMQDKLVFLRDFNKKTAVLAIQRIKELENLNRSKQLYQIN
ncbi:hypothetical protein SAMN05216464_108116 [Mucilaginibacter pineti]|uniref:TerB family tellurite resistance protein n=1 Tax=Mucilaginibacter pineti TaxID=1391627 RepID=A0A1G7EPY7_9SPHI|nr:hypothetical protein [Mucilaginibacter pineti]SDE65741.1 hypothetical protein SAMN05216464_108116 [Mucilaginibacter pineti]